MNLAEKKIKKPCASCPFRRINDLGTDKPGGSEPDVYLGQARGPFWLPCHKDKNYKDKASDPAKVQQCAGAAIFRSNCKGPYKLPEQLLSLPEDHENVFSSEAEFYAHYSGASVEACEEMLDKDLLDTFLKIELSKV